MRRSLARLWSSSGASVAAPSSSAVSSDSFEGLSVDEEHTFSTKVIPLVNSSQNKGHKVFVSVLMFSSSDTGTLSWNCSSCLFSWNRLCVVGTAQSKGHWGGSSRRSSRFQEFVKDFAFFTDLFLRSSLMELYIFLKSSIVEFWIEWAGKSRPEKVGPSFYTIFFPPSFFFVSQVFWAWSLGACS